MRRLYPTDEYYGHNQVLGTYCGFDSPPPLLAQLQHGWNATTGFSESVRFVGWLPKLVWNEANAHELRRRLPISQRPTVHVIGAPFLYLQRVLAERPSRAMVEPSGSLAYPYHQGDGRSFFGQHGAFADALGAREDGPVTVCLAVKEFGEPAVRSTYEDRGFEVICHGQRTDPRFLCNQWEALSRHRRVVTNRVSTALWYGASLGREVNVYGPVFSVDGPAEAEAFDRAQRRRWPALFGDGTSGADAVRLGRAQLGADSLLAPSELRALAGWSGSRRALGPLVSFGLELRRRLLSPPPPG